MLVFIEKLFAGLNVSRTIWNCRITYGWLIVFNMFSIFWDFLETTFQVWVTVSFIRVIFNTGSEMPSTTLLLLPSDVMSLRNGSQLLTFIFSLLEVRYCDSSGVLPFDFILNNFIFGSNFYENNPSLVERCTFYVPRWKQKIAYVNIIKYQRLLLINLKSVHSIKMAFSNKPYGPC